MLFTHNGNKPKVLAIGSHPDDIELGCAGFLFRLLKENKAEIHFAVMTYGTQHWQKGHVFEKSVRAREALEAAQVLLEIPEKKDAQEHLHLGGFKDCELSNTGHSLITFIEDLIDQINPEIILTHAPDDLHDDHRQTYYATLSAARNSHASILFYQTVSTIPNKFVPTVFVNLTQAEFDAKMRSLESHSSQREKDFMSQARISRMVEAWAAFHRMNGGSKLEAFMLHQSFWK